MQIKVKTPAKINLTLEMLGKREDGFHELQSIMQMINLYDYLTFDIEPAQKFEIKLSGTNPNIPYDERNIVYKAIMLFAEKTNILPHKFSVNLEKNIPSEAGLAGGSTNAVGAFVVLNKYFNYPLSKKELNELCAKLGSDLNVILEGGCTLATGRGEVVESLKFREYSVSLIKPTNFGISTKEGYKKYSELKDKPNKDCTHKMISALNNNEDIRKFLQNDLEIAPLSEYKELQVIKEANPESVMSGSGSTYFVLADKINPVADYWTKNGLKTIATGCEIID